MAENVNVKGQSNRVEEFFNDATESIQTYIKQMSGLEAPPIQNGNLDRALEGPLITGYPNTRKDIPEQYMIVIRSSFGRGAIIRASIQDKISLEVVSEWQPFLAGFPKIAQAAVQFLSGRALLSTFATRRIWLGTAPLTFTIPLKFEATVDAEKEVVSACRSLQKLVLPSQGPTRGRSTAARFGNSITAIPPGPSPYSAKRIGEIISGRSNPAIIEGEHFLGVGDIITVNIGTLLKFTPVIVRKVSVQYGTELTSSGLPISATADVTIETYEVLTKESLDEAYNIIDPVTEVHDVGSKAAGTSRDLSGLNQQIETQMNPNQTLMA